jgi:hypothetical protein
MTRAQTLLVTSAIALVVPLAAATAQSSAGKCGPETWSTDKMAYVNIPCNAGDATASVGPNSASSSMTKAEMKAGTYYQQPMPSQAVSTGAPMVSMADQSCGALNAVAITDEYGRRYNCRGDRIR